MIQYCNYIENIANKTISDVYCMASRHHHHHYYHQHNYADTPSTISTTTGLLVSVPEIANTDDKINVVVLTPECAGAFNHAFTATVTRSLTPGPAGSPIMFVSNYASSPLTNIYHVEIAYPQAGGQPLSILIKDTPSKGAASSYQGEFSCLVGVTPVPGRINTYILPKQ